MAGIENIQSSSAVTPVSATAPAARDAKLWDAAKQFEQVLTEQLAKQLQATAQPSQDDDSGDDDSGDDSTTGAQDAVSNMYTQMLPGALSQAVSAGGGLGLAQKLYDSMAQKQQVSK
jgi:Rod binding domain-containing protein